MNRNRFLLFAFVLFFLCAVPFLMVQTSGVAGAGLSAGFSAPLSSVSHLVLFLLLGMWASLLPRDGLMLVPLACLFMLVVGAVAMLPALGQQMALLQFLLGGVLCFGVACGLSRHKSTLLSVLVAGSFGFHMGMHYLGYVPSTASPLFYLLGLILCAAMVLAISVSFGVTLLGDHEQFWLHMKESPRFAWVRSLLR